MIKTLLNRKEDIQAGKQPYLNKVLIYGEPTTGKTELAATVAGSSQIDKVYWFDLDQSLATLVYSPRITDEMRAKIIAFHVPGSMREPYAAELFLKGFTGRRPHKLCQEHATINCSKCKDHVSWSLYTLGPRDCVVIDPGSKLAEILFGYASLENTTDNKIQWWGDFYGYMDDIQSALLDCPTNVIWIAHELDITKIVNKGTKQEREVLVRTVPMCGSRNYSKKFSKDYGYKIATYIAGSKFKATTTPGEYGKAITGARRPVPLYNDEGNPSLVPMFDPEFYTPEQTADPNSLSIKPKLR